MLKIILNSLRLIILNFTIKKYIFLKIFCLFKKKKNYEEWRTRKKIFLDKKLNWRNARKIEKWIRSKKVNGELWECTLKYIWYQTIRSRAKTRKCDK